MKFILTLAFAYFFSTGNAQTPLIAHKSHAGTSNSYLIASSSNFGAIEMKFDPQSQPPQLYKSEKFKPLNDSVMIVEVTDFEQKVIQIDTIPNQHRYSLVQFQYKYQDSIQKSEQQYREKEYQLKMEQEEELKKQQNQPVQESAPIKKKKKSYLLFLFGITGGGMLLMKLFSKSKPIQQSIA
ncbi:hypothetical protein [Fluviicola taffensis]|uniref:hypothetical protein n=1 Tax=Fluviicola taffensis TaxID=191579 RepID=UPI003137DABC